MSTTSKAASLLAPSQGPRRSLPHAGRASRLCCLLLLLLPFAALAQDPAALRKYSAKHPQEPDPYFQLGLHYAHEGNITAIRRYFTKLEQLAPDYPNALAHYYWAVIDYTDECYEGAVLHLNRYFELVAQTQDKEQMKVYEEASNYLYWSQFLSEALLSQVPFNPVVVPGVSSRSEEMLPYLTWDGQEFYFLRMVEEKQPASFYTKNNVRKVPMLCVSRRKDSTFTAGEPLPYPFNQGAAEGSVSLTADGREIYFTRQNGKSFDIYMAERKDGVWQEAVLLGPQVNDPKAWDAQPTVTPDGQYLYFASNRSGGQGGTDIYRCHRLPNGDWSRAQNLGEAVNTPGNEKNPFICGDGHTLFFSSNGWQGFGGYDMYFIDLDCGAIRPTNLGMPINGEQDEAGFGVTADGRQGYFANKDIFLFELYPDARPQPYVATGPTSEQTTRER